MTPTQEEQIEELKILTSELDQDVRALKRVLAEDKESEDKESEDPEALLNDLE